ncbi:MAG TPA: nitroreductase family deazaflavin-dependent oxidoreductase [Acidimicrobiales bacterium]|jgi:deazaflavin-dependent oxidoreductase (nitroreductase family)|nr:nitroreductase family deazaflavin-dependent oxidoreductase [Acidimicrobiales bacterium]
MRRPDPPDILFKTVTTTHEALYRLTGGKIGGRMMGMPVLLLTTVGRKSAQKRTTPLTYFTEGDAVVLVASKGGHPKHPAWYLNLQANPEVEVVQGRTTRTLTARTATSEEKERLWPVITATYKGYAGYQERTDREIPLVILEAR